MSKISERLKAVTQDLGTMDLDKLVLEAADLLDQCEKALKKIAFAPDADLRECIETARATLAAIRSEE